ncbi:MAG: hypothetical protein OZ923_03600 [Comamonadaceae bacterium]|nr:DUF4892 domain-containing protein [Burkholderiales bacterium]MEB2347674.1 hypothetical protein [Comamonadaceae bacterium]
MRRSPSTARIFVSGCVLTLTSLSPLALHAADLEGSADHPLVPRYEGSEIIHYSASAFARHTFAQAAIKKGGGFGGNPDAALSAEGKLTTIVYRAPQSRQATG